MGKVKKQTRKIRQKAANGDLRRLPKSSTARANKRRRHERERIAAKAEAMDDDEKVVETEAATAKSVEEMDIDELLDVGDDGDEVAAHAAEMKALADTDPDFYQHLVKSNPDLLKFGDDHDDVDETDDEPDDVESETDEDGEQTSSSLDLAQIVPALLRSVRQQKSQRSLKRLIRLFRVASHAADHDDDGADASKSDADTAVQDLRVADPAAFDRLLRTLLKYVPRFLAEQLGGADPKRSPHWKQLEGATKSFLGNAVHFMGQCVEPRLLRLTLRALSPALALLAPFPKLCQRYLKALLQIWAQGTDQARIEAFLQLRSLVQSLKHRPAFVSAAFRGLYGTFVRNAKFLTAVNAPVLRFMQNCIVELFALDDAVSYQHAFVYIRQIAVRLRANTAQVDAQLVNSVRVWAHVLTRLAADQRSALRPLCYPFTQVVLALVASHASCRYFPLHLQCAEMLHEVGAVTGQYVPLAAPLLGVICATNWAPVGSAAEKAAAATRATAKAPPIETMIAASNSALRSKAFQDSVMNRAVALLRLHLTRYSRSIAFPELGAPIRRSLNKFASETKIVRFRKLAQKLAVQIASNMTFIESRRGDCDFSPKDREAIAAWSAALAKTPLEAYTESAGDGEPTREAIAELERDDDDDDGSIGSQIEDAIDAINDDHESDGDSNADDVVDDLVISSDDEDDHEHDSQ